MVLRQSYNSGTVVRFLCSNRTIVVVVQSFTIVVRYSLISNAVVLTSYDSSTGNNLAVAIGWKPGYKVCDQTMHKPNDLFPVIITFNYLERIAE